MELEKETIEFLGIKIDRKNKIARSYIQKDLRIP